MPTRAFNFSSKYRPLFKINGHWCHDSAKTSWATSEIWIDGSCFCKTQIWKLDSMFGAGCLSTKNNPSNFPSRPGWPFALYFPWPLTWALGVMLSRFGLDYRPQNVTGKPSTHKAKRLNYINKFTTWWVPTILCWKDKLCSSHLCLLRGTKVHRCQPI